MWIDDQVLQSCSEPLHIKLWIPQQPVVVLGRSNRSEREVSLAACQRDAVEVVKRLGGGGTVLLHKGCLVLSVGCWVREFYFNDRYFCKLNQAVIDTLEQQLPEHKFQQRGYSDIVFEGRKFAGTSLFRSRNYLLYQASLLVETRIEAIERYLPHPSAEPDYRQGRSHRDFLMGLNELAPWTPSTYQEHFEKNFTRLLRHHLHDELIDPPAVQLAHVLSRMGEA